MKKLDQAAFQWLGEQLDEPPPPDPGTDGLHDEGWNPRLNPTQRRTFDSVARYILAYGEKGSGKTIGLLHKVVRHCYENQNALGVILVKVADMALKGGAWEKLMNHIIPEWKDGIGMIVSEVKYDRNHNEYIWLQNALGGWSKITLMSAPHGHQLRERIRGYEPSIVFVDELTSCDSIEYWRSVAAQIGRRPGIDGPQQYLAACNPEGPSHWVYKVWWEDAFDEESGNWDTDFEKWHIPIQENAKNLQPGYLEGLEKLYKSDPIEADRMLRGLWIDRPSGDSLFRDSFSIHTHVRPLKEDLNPDHKRRLMPIRGHPIIVGMDPGAVFNAYCFMQWLPPIEGITPWTDEMGWLIFDEICVFKRKIDYRVLTRSVMQKIAWWRGVAGFMHQVWISDNSAFNQFRAANGSYDVLEIDRAYARYQSFFGMEPNKTKPAPKFSGSRAVRVRLTNQLLSEDRIILSSQCVNTRQMFLNLESEKQKPGEFDPDKAMTPKRSDWIHIFDAMTYPIITSTLEPNKLLPQKSSQEMI